MTDERKKQAAKQCRAVSYMAKAIANVYEDYAFALADGGMSELVEQIGARTARQMETLGNMLNGMDATTEDDEWLDPVFEKSRQLWPEPLPDTPRAGK